MEYNLNKISQYRGSLMGGAILFIVFYHAGIPLFGSGFCGVEFFLLLSAVGISYSLRKNPHLPSFYKKRFLRIVPTYLLVAVPFFLVKDPRGMGFWANITGYSVLFGDKTFWFIFLIMLCYLASPFYYKLVSHKWSIALWMALTAVAFWLGSVFQSCQLLIDRIPIYFLGLHLSRYVMEGKRVGNSFVLFFGGASLLAMVLLQYAKQWMDVQYIYMAFIVTAFPALCFITAILDRLPKNLVACITFIGGITLEIYLLHEEIFMNPLRLYLHPQYANTLSIPLAFLAAWALSKGVNVLMGKIYQNK